MNQLVRSNWVPDENLVLQMFDSEAIARANRETMRFTVVVEAEALEDAHVVLRYVDDRLIRF